MPCPPRGPWAVCGPPSPGCTSVPRGCSHPGHTNLPPPVIPKPVSSYFPKAPLKSASSALQISGDSEKPAFRPRLRLNCGFCRPTAPGQLVPRVTAAFLSAGGCRRQGHTDLAGGGRSGSRVREGPQSESVPDFTRIGRLPASDSRTRPHRGSVSWWRLPNFMQRQSIPGQEFSLSPRWERQLWCRTK